MNTHCPLPKKIGTLCIAVAVMGIASAQTTVANTSPSKDEMAIRALVKKQNESNGKSVLPIMENHIFVSGAFRLPVINGQISADDKARMEQNKTTRLNATQTVRIQKIEVAKAGDMAYEFGYGDLAWDTPQKKHVSFENTYLRIWRKVANQWKVAVFFARPNIAPGSEHD